MEILQYPPELIATFSRMEQEAYSYLVAGGYVQAENAYHTQYDLLISEEQKLGLNQKYHKGGPLHNWGVSLLLQNKLLEGFNKITLAYIEDLLDSRNIEDAITAPAYKALQSYPLISGEFLNQIRQVAAERREQQNIPRDPQEILNAVVGRQVPDLSSTLTPERTKEVPLTAKQMREIIKNLLKGQGKRNKRVFIGGTYKNIAVLRFIKSVVDQIDELKGILPIDLPSLSSDKFDHIVHDMSIECLKGCSAAIFEVSVSNGHLMEIEWASQQKVLRKKVLLLYQLTTPNNKPPITRMLMTTKFKKWGYRDLKELEKKVHEFLGE